MLQIQEHNRLPSEELEEDAPLLYERNATPLCRICLDSEGELLRACDCSGTQGLVHRKCVREWSLKYAPDPTRCELCKTPWKIEMYSPIEKFLQKYWFWFSICSWYVTMMIGFFDFANAACHQNEFTALIVYCIWVSSITIAHDWISKGIYFLHRFTYTIILYGGMIMLLATQEDYQTRKMNIMANPYLSEFHRKQMMDQLKTDMEIDNPFAWPVENYTNRQMWVIVLLDIVLWIAYVIWSKHFRTNNQLGFRQMRISSSDSDISV